MWTTFCIDGKQLCQSPAAEALQDCLNISNEIMQARQVERFWKDVYVQWMLHVVTQLICTTVNVVYMVVGQVWWKFA